MGTSRRCSKTSHLDGCNLHVPGMVAASCRFAPNTSQDCLGYAFVSRTSHIQFTKLSCTFEGSSVRNDISSSRSPWRKASANLEPICRNKVEAEASPSQKKHECVIVNAAGRYRYLAVLHREGSCLPTDSSHICSHGQLHIPTERTKSSEMWQRTRPCRFDLTD